MPNMNYKSHNAKQKVEFITENFEYALKSADRPKQYGPPSNTCQVEKIMQLYLSKCLNKMPNNNSKSQYAKNQVNKSVTGMRKHLLLWLRIHSQCDASKLVQVTYVNKRLGTLYLKDLLFIIQ